MGIYGREEVGKGMGEEGREGGREGGRKGGKEERGNDLQSDSVLRKKLGIIKPPTLQN